MSELMNMRRGQADFRWQLLASVSAAALVASACVSGAALAADEVDRPTVWIELGGQLEQMKNGQEPFAPPFVANIPNTFYSPIGAQKPLQYSFGGEGAISFEPEGSNWVLSASVRFGRSNGVKSRHQETPNAKLAYKHLAVLGKYRTGTKYPSSHVKFEDVKRKQSETHTVLDFQAGREVGLGMLGAGGSSVLSAGIRFAQFSSKTDVSMRAEPDVHYPSAPITNLTGLLAFRSAAMRFHDYAGMETNQRSSKAIGPSVAWKASAPFAGDPDRGQLTIDWGVNAAVLFGQQKASGHHQTTVHSYYKQGFEQGQKTFVGAFGTVSTTQHSNAAAFDRTRTVIVPNLGGFAGVSYCFPDAKLSLGYRADFFFGAMDGGIDTRRTEDVGFFGPFATISIGLP